MSTRRTGCHTPRGIPIMDVINLPSDLPAPMTTRPLLSRTETLARSRPTSRTNSRSNSVSSVTTSVKHRISTNKAMELGSSTMVKSEEVPANNVEGTTGRSSTRRSKVKAEKLRQFVPSSESPEPMEFEIDQSSKHNQMVVDTETQDSISSSQGMKRKRSPTGDLEVGDSATQLVSERGTSSSPSPQLDNLEAQLRDELDLIGEPSASTVAPLQATTSSTQLHQHDELQGSVHSSASRPSGSRTELPTTTYTKRETEGLRDLDTSHVDREDRMKVEAMLDVRGDRMLEGLMSSSSIIHASNSAPSTNGLSSRSSSPIPPSKRDNGKDRARTGSVRSSVPSDPTDIIEITDSPPTAYRVLTPERGHYSNKGKQKAETVDLSFSDDDTQSGQNSSTQDDMVTSAAVVNNQNVEDETHLSSYTCPICFCAPTNATLTPCGHICCGECLFTAIKTTQQRVAVIGPAEDARCPVCRAVIPGWDGKGGGVIGLKIRAVFSL